MRHCGMGGEISVRHLRLVPAFVLLVLLGCGLLSPMAAQSRNSQQQSVSDPGYWDDPVNWKQQFVPDSLAFWDDSKNWTTNYGPAYRDTNIKGSQLLACSSQFAYCFNSGPEPLPCTLSPDGLSANCQCPVQTKTNYTLLTAILNYSVYQATLRLVVRTVPTACQLATRSHRFVLICLVGP